VIKRQADENKTLADENNELRSRLGMKPKRVDRKVARHRREGPKRVTHDRKAFTKPALRGEKSIEIDMLNPYITPIEKEIDIGDFGDHHLPRQTTIQNFELARLTTWLSEVPEKKE